MGGQSIRRAAISVVLAGGAVVGAVAAAPAAQAAVPAEAGYRYQATAGHVVSQVPLNVRYGPGTRHGIVGSLDSGSRVWIACKADGASVHGNYRWYKLAGRGGWVSARYVNNRGFVPWCAG